MQVPGPVLLIVFTSTVAAAWYSRPRHYFVPPIEDVVRRLGYDVERHEITTSDGYILTYHRLPRGRGSSKKKKSPSNRKVLLFNNGILLSSASVLTSRRDFAYEFADAGFDVWVGNYRGNMYSRKHKYLDPDRDLKFWDYSLHELGTQDLTASIDYILGVTGASRLVYVGISMGTTMFWVLGAARPQYMNKIEAMVALAPVARTTHATFLNSPARCNNARVVVTALERLGYREVLRYNETAASMLYNGCTSSWVWRPICLLFINTFEYFTRNNWDNVRLLESLKYSPAGIATKVLHHYIQIAKARTFQQFDYGLEENRRRYHTSGLPPEYDLSNVNCSKIYFVTSDSDLIANKQDVEWLANRLPVRPTWILGQHIQHFSHLGIGIDKQAMDLVITPLANFLRQNFLT
ncbi:lipase lipl-4-like isoform X2 [Macrosteles quadrilineatus]|uniref:lipase lipl-4-like isoform X2 n=1 Tax=Macrosteles quadrilineatus TaxID=74068 RepID=UPI0023E147CE|nr:lipase lipl-4-like isoform X2 [Macrosteles quadrilineatus]